MQYTLTMERLMIFIACITYYKDDSSDGPFSISIPHDPQTSADNRFTLIFPDKPSVILEIQDQYQISHNGLRQYVNSRIMQSEDNGTSWNVVLESQDKFQDIEVSPFTSGTVYALDGGHLYKSTDYGKTWETLADLPRRAVSLALDNKNPNIMILGVSPYPSTKIDVYITYNEGKNWEKLTGTPFSWYPDEYINAEHILSLVSYSKSDRIVYLALAPNGFLHLYWYGIAEVDKPEAFQEQDNVHLSWQNPKDPFFAGVKIYYSDNGEDFNFIADLNNGEIEYTAESHPYFKLTCYDKEGNESKGKIVSTWQDITEGVQVKRSRTLFDRIHHCFFVYLTLTNNSGKDFDGPVRMTLDSSTIPLKNDDSSPGLEPDGYTSDGKSYFIIVPEEQIWKAGQTLERIRLDFQLMRKRLDFTFKFENQSMLQ